VVLQPVMLLDVSNPAHPEALIKVLQLMAMSSHGNVVLLEQPHLGNNEAVGMIVVAMIHVIQLHPEVLLLGPKTDKTTVETLITEVKMASVLLHLHPQQQLLGNKQPQHILPADLPVDTLVILHLAMALDILKQVWALLQVLPLLLD